MSAPDTREQAQHWQCFADVASGVAFQQAEHRALADRSLSIFSGFDGGFVYAARTHGEAARMHESRPARNCGSWF